MNTFDFERLDAFHLAVRMVESVDAIAGQLPRGRAYMRDQLRRAANSVVLNLAEGAGEFSGPEKARFYRMAKRSATEAAAQLIVGRRLGLIREDDALTATAQLHRLVCMLVRMVEAARRRR